MGNFAGGQMPGMAQQMQPQAFAPQPPQNAQMLAMLGQSPGMAPGLGPQAPTPSMASQGGGAGGLDPLSQILMMLQGMGQGGPGGFFPGSMRGMFGAAPGFGAFGTGGPIGGRAGGLGAGISAGGGFGPQATGGMPPLGIGGNNGTFGF